MVGLTASQGRGVGLKFLLVGAVIVLLGAPLLMVSVLVWERTNRANTVSQEIGDRFGGAQTVFGPVVMTPYTYPSVTQVRRDGEFVDEVKSQRGRAFVVAQSVDFDVDQRVELRRRGIFVVPVYTASIAMTGALPGREAIIALLQPSLPANAQLDLSAARVGLAITDVRGIVSTPEFVIGGDRAPAPLAGKFVAGLGDGRLAQGWISAPQPVSGSDTQPFTASLEVSGSQALSVIAAGRSTTMTMTGDWPHPSFSGAFAPREYSTSDAGFEARWAISPLARPDPATWIFDADASGRPFPTATMSVGLVSPATDYQQVGRALKYGFFFVAFALAALFVVEIAAGVRVHPLQYFLIGLAQVVFYVLLLALSEHAPMSAAFAVSAAATIALCGVYAVSVFRTVVLALAVAGVLAATYALQYAVLVLEDYALLIGAVIAFCALAATMAVTRQVQWYGDGDGDGGKADPSGGVGV